MSETVHIYVGTDERSEKCERVLEHSVRKHTDAEVEFHWMRAGSAGWSWQASPSAPDGNWHTLFTNFRYAIPYVHPNGRCIYMDSDQMVFGDVAELVKTPMRDTAGFLCVHKKRTCVSVIDCDRFEDPMVFRIWPKITEMKENLRGGWWYRQQLIKYQLLDDSLDGRWNDADNYEDGLTKLTHFTRVETQPWRPWPEVFHYDEQHACPEAVEMWWHLYEESLSNGRPEDAVSRG